MDKYKTIKINGLNLESLLLALFLSKYNFKIYINDLINQDYRSKYNEKVYVVTNSTKIILQELNLWERLEKSLYDFESLSIFYNYMKEEILIGKNDFLNENIGWTLKYSDLKEQLLKKLFNNKNIYFLKSLNTDSFQNKYDYEFNFVDISNLSSKLNKGILFGIENKTSSIEFKVMVRGNFDKRAYQIFHKKDSIFMIPLSKNIYQIIWKGNTKKLKNRMNININFLIDNLSTILPKDFKIDQIVGGIKFFPNSLIPSKNIKFKKNYIYLNNFNPAPKPYISDDLENYIIDIKSLSKIFITNKICNKNLSIYYKIRFLFQRLLNVSPKFLIQNSLLILFLNLNILPDIFIKFTNFKLQKSNFIKRFFINIIFK